jgi:hypothetical protein
MWLIAKGPRPSVVAGPDGVTFYPSGASFRFRDLVRVVASKSDLLTTDLIVLSFEMSGGEVYTVDEESPGFEHLTEVLAAELPGHPSFRQWFAAVALPPFEESRIVLWSRKKATA